MKLKRSVRWLIFFTVFLLGFSSVALADAAPGDVIVTIGEDLTDEQEQNILEEMGVAGKNLDIVYVTNEEEHRYLGDYISAQQIGSNAISSAKITLLKEGAGISVTTNNITYITEAMYANALVTAGVKDARIYVTAPFPVSGTAALTGILKAYDLKTDLPISEEQKKVANEELVRTAQLGEAIGKEKATELVTRLKEEIAQNPIQNKEDLRQLILNVAGDLNIQLNDQQIEDLMTLLEHIQNLDINWEQLQNELQKFRENFQQFANSEEARSLIEQLLSALESFIEFLRSLLS